MIPYEKRRKLDDKAERMKFIGYDDSSKGFRFVDRNGKVHVSREAHFVDTKEHFAHDKQIVEIEDFEITLNNSENDDRENDDGDIFFDANDNINEEVEFENDNIGVRNQEVENQFNETIEDVIEIPVEEVNVDQPRRSTRQNAGKIPTHFDDFEVYACKEHFDINEMEHSVKEPKLWNAKNQNIGAKQWKRNWKLLKGMIHGN